MNRLIRITLITAATVLALLVLVFAALTTWLDPNDYKGHIEALAAEQGVVLRLQGDLSWRLLPALAIEMHAVEVGMAGAAVTLARVEQVAAAVQLLPLLSGQIQIDAIAVRGASVTAQVEPDGRRNWQPVVADPAATPATSVTTAPAAPPAAAADAPDKPMGLAVSRLQITDMDLSYRDLSGATDIALERVNLELTAVNLDGELFPVRLSAALSRAGDVPPLQLDLSGQLSFSDKLLQLQPLQLSVAPLQGTAGRLVLDMQGSVDLRETPGADLTLSLSQTNLREWLALLNLPQNTADAAALTRLQFTSTLHLSGDYVSLSPLQVTLDDSTLKGAAYLNQPGQLPLLLDVSADKIDLDRYLPAPASTVAAPSAAPPAAQSPQSPLPPPPAPPLPLQTLRDLHYKIVLAVDELQVKGARVNSVVLESHAQAGVIHLDQFSVNAYEGTVTARGQLDAQGQQARLDLSSQLNGVELLGLLTDMRKEERLSGKVGGSISASARGRTQPELLQGLAASIRLSAETLLISGLDIERNVCELAATLSQEPLAERSWRGNTPLQNLDAELQLRDQVLQLVQVSSGIDAIAARASGAYQLASGNFDIPLTVRIGGARDAALACQIRDKWRNRDLPLRCKGNVAKVGAGTCLPDKAALKSLLTDEVKAKAQDKLNQKLQEKLGGDDAEPLQNLLKGLLNK